MNKNIFDKFVEYIYKQTKIEEIKKAMTKIELELYLNPNELINLRRNFELKLTNEEKRELSENFSEDFKSFKVEVLELLNSTKKEDKGLATERIVERIKLNNYIYTTRNDLKSEMFIYKDGIYIPQGRTYIKEFCREITGQTYTTHLANQVIVKIEDDTRIDEDELFNKINVAEVPVLNGILNIFTRHLSGFTPTKIFFSKLPISYDKDKDCPKIKQFFKDVLKDDNDILVMQELFGTLLEKENRLEKMFLFTGSGRNGKGKTLELMRKFLGIENICAIPIQEIQNDDFRLSELRNKYANLGGDIDSTSLSKTGTIKSVTGRDMMSAKRKFLTDINFIPFAKQIFCANELPISYDLSPAFFSRVRLIDYPFTFKTQEEIDKEEDKTNLKLIDPEIIEHITSEDELSGLLNWALDGLDRTIKQNNYSYSPIVDEVKNMWIRKSDSFSGFLLDCVEYDWDAYINKQELRKAYTEYCRINKLKSSSDKRIKDILNLNGISDDRISLNDNQERVWMGLKLKELDRVAKIDRGFTLIQKNQNFDIRVKEVANLSKLSNLDNFKLEVKEEKVE